VERGRIHGSGRVLRRPGDGVQRATGSRGSPKHAPHDCRDAPRTDLLLADVELVALSETLLEPAGRLPDPHLRTLDGIHLATALLIRDDIESLLAYDDRLAQAAREHGLPVVAPT
jgi:hypothetical protein